MTIDADARRERLADRRNDLVALTRALIRIPTLNPSGDREAREAVAARLRPSGFACRLPRAEAAPGDSDRHPRWNLIARREDVSRRPCVHFNGHIDLVEVGQGWTTDPFGGDFRDGRIYGRGACDVRRDRGGHRRGRGVRRALARPPLSYPDLGHRRRGDRLLRRRRVAG